ncbi:MAG: hypothetical protein IPH20_10280 [Bacteroidales bacterium]|nr:hypothetical protein [Bacteroidales bacterium]
MNHQWNEKFSSMLGYSAIITDNSDGQRTDAFPRRQICKYQPVVLSGPNVTAGIELQWIGRKITAMDGKHRQRKFNSLSGITSNNCCSLSQ